ncbi:MAG: hypothetical protein ACLUDY_18285 [Bacteroides xylanisolvens]
MHNTTWNWNSLEELQSQHDSKKTPDKTTVVALTITAKLSTPIFRPIQSIVPIFKGRPVKKLK